MKDFDTFGVMIDMSRNAVMSIEGLKRFLPLLKSMGYHCVMLYMEDTYEVDGEPYFGYMRGRYSKAEMKEIDRIAGRLGMQVIPCIQTLAHLPMALRWGKIPVDCDNILLADDPRTYELIEHMFSTLSECFASRRIHVGMDEAHMLGRGKHLDIHGYEEIGSIMKRHLDRVLAIAEKYGYEVMLWSDMYFRAWNSGRYSIPKCEIPEEVVRSFPESVIPIYWDYDKTEEKAYLDMIENHKQLSDKTWFAGGAWSWYGMIPYNRFTIQAMVPAIDACRKQGIRNVIFTMWGDDGAECSHFSQLPSLFYLAQYADGCTDEQQIKERFGQFTGISFDDFMGIDFPNDVVKYTGRPRNPSKYMLYSDYFNDFLDDTVKLGAGKQYDDYAQQLRKVASESSQYGYLFDSAANLCDVLAIKYELGLRTRKAYEAGDRDTLKSLAEQEYVQVEKRIRTFAQAFAKQWMSENKPHGFDVQDLRIGGLLYRTESCRQRLLDFADGKLTRIEELDEPLLPFREKETSTNANRGGLFATVNVLYETSMLKP